MFRVLSLSPWRILVQFALSTLAHRQRSSASLPSPPAPRHRRSMLVLVLVHYPLPANDFILHKNKTQMYLVSLEFPSIKLSLGWYNLLLYLHGWLRCVVAGRCRTREYYKRVPPIRDIHQQRRLSANNNKHMDGQEEFHQRVHQSVGMRSIFLVNYSRKLHNTLILGGAKSFRRQLIQEIEIIQERTHTGEKTKGG